MKVLVTGGAGFIGSHLVSALCARGDSVRILDDLSSGRRENLDPPSSRGNGGGLELMVGDVRDAAQMADAVREIDVIFHEAAFVSVAQSMERPQECFDVNCTGTSLLLEAARTAGVRRVVLASSAAVYGDSAELPLREDSALRPGSPYAASKLVDETYAALYSRVFGLEVCALRYFNVFGPRQRPDSPYAAAVPIFIHSLLLQRAPTIFGDGNQTRDLVFVGDIVRANLIAAEHPAAPGQVFNICTGRKTRILDLIEVLYKLLPGAPPPRSGPARSGDIYESWGSPEKARQTLGFEAQTELLEGLSQTVRSLQ
jgi:UDP-glucose 4-epimerase